MTAEHHDVSKGLELAADYRSRPGDPGGWEALRAHLQGMADKTETYRLADLAMQDQYGKLHAEFDELRIKAAGAGVPEGWKRVPVEPTFEMQWAGDAVWHNGDNKRESRVWKAMLYAAPVAPAIVPLTFEQAWVQKAAQGYRYGDDALEQVRLGWNMAHDVTGSAAPAAPTQAANMPAGYALVPVKPTTEMWDAAWRSIGLPYRAKLSLHEIKTLFDLFHAAMLAAAPAAPQLATSKPALQVGLAGLRKRCAEIEHEFRCAKQVENSDELHRKTVLLINEMADVLWPPRPATTEESSAHEPAQPTELERQMREALVRLSNAYAFIKPQGSPKSDPEKRADAVLAAYDAAYPAHTGRAEG